MYEDGRLIGEVPAAADAAHPPAAPDPPDTSARQPRAAEYLVAPAVPDATAAQPETEPVREAAPQWSPPPVEEVAAPALGQSESKPAAWTPPQWSPPAAAAAAPAATEPSATKAALWVPLGSTPLPAGAGLAAPELPESTPALWVAPQWTLPPAQVTPSPLNRQVAPAAGEPTGQAAPSVSPAPAGSPAASPAAPVGPTATAAAPRATRGRSSWTAIAVAAAAAVALLAAGLVGYRASRGSAGEADKSADQIFGDAVAAMGSLSSYHLHQTGKDGRLTASEDLTVRAPGTATGALSANGGNAEEVIVGSARYVKGGAWFRAALPQVASAVGDQWVRFPGDAREYTFSSPASIKRCMPVEHGTLTKGQLATVDGHQVIELVDGGDRPGSAPGTYDVAVDGTPYLLRMVRSAGSRGGGDAACGDTRPQTGTFTADFDGFNATVPPIAAPSASIAMPSPDQAYVEVLRNDYGRINSVVPEEAKACQTSASSCYAAVLDFRGAIQQTVDDLGPLQAPAALHDADVRLRSSLNKVLPDIDAMLSAAVSGNRATLLAATERAQADGLAADAAFTQIFSYTPAPLPPSSPSASGTFTA